MTFFRQCLSVFSVMVVLDVVFALYVATVARGDILAASSWAAAIQVCNVFVVSSFVKDRRLVVPCALGAFFGTGLAMVLL